MKITQLETIYVKPRWLFLKIHTDEGIVGLGEPVVEGRSQTVAAAIQEIGRYLIKQDPRNGSGYPFTNSWVGLPAKKLGCTAGLGEKPTVITSKVQK